MMDIVLISLIGPMHAHSRLWALEAKARAQGLQLQYRDAVKEKITEAISEKHRSLVEAASDRPDSSDFIIQGMLEYLIEDLSTLLQEIDLRRITEVDTSASESEAFDKGFESLPIDECPFKEGTKQWAAWHAGRNAK